MTNDDKSKFEIARALEHDRVNTAIAVLHATAERQSTFGTADNADVIALRKVATAFLTQYLTKETK